MSYLQRKTNYAHGVRCFLDKQGYDVSGKGKKENDIMVSFLKEKGLPFKKWNSRYKGLNTANLINAETIQENFKEFRNWVLNKDDKTE